MIDSYALAVAKMNDLKSVRGDIGEYVRTEFGAGTTPGCLVAAAGDEDGCASTQGAVRGLLGALRWLLRPPRAANKAHGPQLDACANLPNPSGIRNY